MMRDIDRLRTNGAASAEDLRQFLSQMKGRSPQEVLGAVAESGLTQGIILSCIGCLALLALFTVLPYYYFGPADAQAGDPAAKATAAEESVAPRQAQPADVEAESPAVSTPQTSEDDKQRAVEMMGIGESKMADPDKNPLESKLDRLLDGVE